MDVQVGEEEKDVPSSRVIFQAVWVRNLGRREREWKRRRARQELEGGELLSDWRCVASHTVRVGPSFTSLQWRQPQWP